MRINRLGGKRIRILLSLTNNLGETTVEQKDRDKYDSSGEQVVPYYHADMDKVVGPTIRAAILCNRNKTFKAEANLRDAEVEHEFAVAHLKLFDKYWPGVLKLTVQEQFHAVISMLPDDPELLNTQFFNKWIRENREIIGEEVEKRRAAQ